MLNPCTCKSSFTLSIWPVHAQKLKLWNPGQTISRTRYYRIKFMAWRHFNKEHIKYTSRKFLVLLSECLPEPCIEYTVSKPINIHLSSCIIKSVCLYVFMNESGSQYFSGVVNIQICSQDIAVRRISGYFLYLCGLKRLSAKQHTFVSYFEGVS